MTSIFFSDGLVQAPTSTPCKINMEPKTGGLEDDFPFQEQVILMVFDFIGEQILIFLSGPSIKFTGPLPRRRGLLMVNFSIFGGHLCWVTQGLPTDY